MRCIGVDTVAAAHAADNDGIEPCGFDEDVLRLRRNHGLPTTHDAGETEGLLLVSHNNVICIEHAVYTVKSLELLARSGAAHEDGTFNLVDIEGMRRMAHANQ